MVAPALPLPGIFGLSNKHKFTWLSRGKNQRTQITFFHALTFMKWPCSHLQHHEISFHMHGRCHYALMKLPGGLIFPFWNIFGSKNAQNDHVFFIPRCFFFIPPWYKKKTTTNWEFCTVPQDQCGSSLGKSTLCSREPLCPILVMFLPLLAEWQQSFCFCFFYTTWL